MAEYLDILDEKGRKTGARKLRTVAHKKGFWHKGVYIAVFDKKGRILIQKRAPGKDICPGFWDVSCAGHVLSGETPVKAALRELDEELNLKASVKDLRFLGIRKLSLYYKKLIENEFCYFYKIIYKGKLSDLHKQRIEVSLLKFIPLKKLKSEIKNTRSYLNYTQWDSFWKALFEFI